jgi:hypothetical protein
MKSKDKEINQLIKKYGVLEVLKQLEDYCYEEGKVNTEYEKMSNSIRRLLKIKLTF